MYENNVHATEFPKYFLPSISQLANLITSPDSHCPVSPRLLYRLPCAPDLELPFQTTTLPDQEWDLSGP